MLSLLRPKLYLRFLCSNVNVQGSSDMCTMTNEEELYDFCFSNELLTLGWIHVRLLDRTIVL
jgi:hypothetical protein